MRQSRAIPWPLNHRRQAPGLHFSADRWKLRGHKVRGVVNSLRRFERQLPIATKSHPLVHEYQALEMSATQGLESIFQIYTLVKCPEDLEIPNASYDHCVGLLGASARQSAAPVTQAARRWLDVT